MHEDGRGRIEAVVDTVGSLALEESTLFATSPVSSSSVGYSELLDIVDSPTGGDRPGDARDNVDGSEHCCLAVENPESVPVPNVSTSSFKRTKTTYCDGQSGQETRTGCAYSDGLVCWTSCRPAAACFSSYSQEPLLELTNKFLLEQLVGSS
jgi:hypothetical protein